MCGIVWTPRCAMWECGRAPRPRRGCRVAEGSRQCLRGLERAESARVFCGRRAGAGAGQRGPRAPREGRTRPGPESRGRSEAAPGAGRVCVGWGRRGRAACLRPTVTEEGWAQRASLGCLGPPVEKPVVFPGLWNPIADGVGWRVLWRVSGDADG